MKGQPTHERGTSRPPALDRDRYQRIRELVHSAAEIEGEARRQFLDRSCGDDADLREQVETLLELGVSESQTPLDTPAINPSLLREALTQGIDEADSDAANTVIDGFRIVRRIGEGGMGIVYEAEQERPRRRVALKVIRPTMATRELIRRFERETQILGQLQHPGIAQIFEAGTVRTTTLGGGIAAHPYFAMELIHGPSLTAYAAAHDLSIRSRLKLVAKICDAVQYAHQKGVVHRDLKPANILIVGEESPPSKQNDALGDPTEELSGAGLWKDGRRIRPVILDFGVARLIGADAPIMTVATDIGQIVGTLSYMSPEQIIDSRNTDTRSDVYSIGVILYELLAGCLPLDVGQCSIVDAARIIREQEPRRLSVIRPVFRGDIATIVDKALEKSPDRRYASAADLSSDLRRYLSDQPIVARAPTTTYLVKKFVQRHRALVVGVASTVVALLLAVVGTTWFAFAAQDARRHADLRAEQLNRELYASRIHHIHRIIDTDGSDPVRQIIAQCDESLRGWEWHRLNWLSDRSLATLEVTQEKLESVEYSSDGNRLVTANTAGPIKIWDSDTLDLVLELPRSTGCHHAQFGAKGTKVAGCGIDGRVLVWDATTGAVIWEHFFREKLRLESVALDPTGRSVAIGWWDTGTPTEVWDIMDDRRLFDLASPANRATALRFTADGTKLLVGALGGEVSISKMDDGSMIFSEKGADSVVLEAVFSHDEKWIASIGNEGRLRIRDAETGALLLDMNTGKGLSRALAFQPGSRKIVVGSIDGVLTLFDATNGDRIGSLRGHESEIFAVSFHPDGRRMASSARDGNLKFWDVGVVRQPYADINHLHAVQFSADDHSLYFGGVRDGVRRLNIDAKSAQVSGKPMPHVDEVAVSPDGRFVGVWASDGDWTNAKGIAAVLDDQLNVLHSQLTDFRMKPEFSPDNRQMLYLDGLGNLASLSTESGVSTPLLSDAKEQFTCATFADAGQSIILGTIAGHIEVRDAGAMRLIRRFRAHPIAISQLILAPHTQLLVTGAFPDVSNSVDNEIRVWDWPQGRLKLALPNIRVFRCMTIDPTGSRLATGSFDGAVRLWDLLDGRELMIVGRHHQAVNGLAFSRDGRMLASCGRDHTLRIWESASSLPPATLVGGR